MFKVRTVRTTIAHSKVATQASFAASKVKNKILNTSSFFKLSLKTNNKALAVALATEKERSRCLEREVTYLLKQADELRFQLATKKYMQRKLFIILKNLQSYTLNHLEMVANVFASDCDDPQLFGDCQTSRAKTEDVNVPIEVLAEQITSQSNQKNASWRPQKSTQGLSLPLNDDGVLRQVRSSDCRCNDDKGRESLTLQPAQTPSLTITRPSRSLKDDVDTLSIMYSKNGSGMITVPCDQCPDSVQSNCENSRSVVSASEESRKPEHTVCLGTTMDLTVPAATEIVTVGESSFSDKMKNGKNKTEDDTAVIDKPQERNSQEIGASKFTDIVKETKIIEPQLDNPHNKHQIASRIPKIVKTIKPKRSPREKGNLQLGNKLDIEVMDTHSPDIDYCYNNVLNKKCTTSSEPVYLKPQEDTEAMSNINCRRSKAKSQRKSSASRKTFFVSCIPSSESNESRRAYMESEQPLASPKYQNQEEDEAKRLGSNKKDTEYMSENVSDNVCQNAAVENEEPTEIEMKVGSKINYRKSRNKKERQATRKTFDLPPLAYCESDHANIEVVEVTERDEESTDLGHPGLPARSMDQSHKSSVQDSTTENHKDTQQKIMCDESHKSKCRGTFVIATNCFSLPSNVSAEEDTVMYPSKEAENATDVKESCKRPWVATRDTEDGNLTVPLNDENADPFSVFQIPKKIKMDDTKAYKKQSVQEGRKKRKKKSAHSHKGNKMKSDPKIADISEAADNAELVDSLFDHQEDELHTGVDETRLRMNRNPKQYRKTSSHAPKNVRETFVVNSHFSSERSSTTKDKSNSESPMTIHQDLELVTDEMPPWLDVTSLDSEMSSVLCTPRRAITGMTVESATPPNKYQAGRVLTSLTNTISTPDNEDGRKTRRRKGTVNYKEPSLNGKLRRGDKFF